jgi:hypothetical protein
MDEDLSAEHLEVNQARGALTVENSASDGEMPVFEGAAQLVECLRILVRRPRLREAPHSPDDVRLRGLDRGIPMLCLVRAEDNGALLKGLARYLAKARPGRMPHVVYRYESRTSDIGPADSGLEVRRAPAAHEDAADIAEILRQISQGLAGGAGSRIRFARFGLVRWLITQDLESEDADSDTVLRTRLRQRDLAGARYAGVFSKQVPELMDDSLTRWGRFLQLLPPVWFLARISGRVPGVGQEYRWLLRQPYLAPRDPGTVLGFAERLTVKQRMDEDAEQVLRLLMRAFLSDVSRAYRRPLWRPRGARRTTYPVVFLDGVTRANNGYRLLRLINDVRNDSGDFDPLVFVSASQSVPPDAALPDVSVAPAPVPASAAVDAYDDWCRRILLDSRRRARTAWYLPVRVPSVLTRPVGPDSAGPYLALSQDIRRPPGFVIQPPPFWARRWIAVFTVTALLAAFGGSVYRMDRSHCGRLFLLPSAVRLSREQFGTNAVCVGITDGSYRFLPKDRLITTMEATILQQNAAAERDHHLFPHRPYVSLVYTGGLAPSEGTAADFTEQGLELLAYAALQKFQLSENDQYQPLLNIRIASGGPAMAAHATVAAQVRKAATDDPSIIGVVGLDQSRKATLDLISQLTKDGLPVMSATLSADQLNSISPLYFQTAPYNVDEAAAVWKFAQQLRSPQGRDGEHLKGNDVTIVCPTDPTDNYSQSLAHDLIDGSFAHWNLTVESYPTGDGSTVGGSCKAQSKHRHNTAGEVGKELYDHHYRGLVVFVGRKDDFRSFREENGQSSPSDDTMMVVADDDISSVVANANQRQHLGSHYWYVSFGDPKSGMPVVNDYLAGLQRSDQGLLSDVNLAVDGHAALAYAAGLEYVEAVHTLAAKYKSGQVPPAALVAAELNRERSSPVITTPAAGQETCKNDPVQIIRVSNGSPERLSCGSRAR